jgi:hypothetical protein
MQWLSSARRILNPNIFHKLARALTFLLINKKDFAQIRLVIQFFYFRRHFIPPGGLFRISCLTPKPGIQVVFITTGWVDMKLPGEFSLAGNVPHSVVTASVRP